MPTLSQNNKNFELSQEETKKPKQLTTNQTNESRFVTKVSVILFTIFISIYIL